MNAPGVLVADAAQLPWPGGGALPRPTLGQCLLLALLLHLWLVAMVGTTPGAAGPHADGGWGPLRIRLEGAGPADSPARVDRPAAERGLLGRAPEPRFGGAVRDAEPLPSPEPGAAQLGQWSPQPTPDALRPRSAPPPAAAEPAPQPATPPVLLQPARPTPPALPAETAALPLQPTAPEPKPLPDPGAGPSTAPRVAPQDTLEAPVLQRPERSHRDLAPSANAPAAVPLPVPPPRLPDGVRAAPASADPAPAAPPVPALRAAEPAPAMLPALPPPSVPRPMPEAAPLPRVAAPVLPAAPAAEPEAPAPVPAPLPPVPVPPPQDSPAAPRELPVPAIPPRSSPPPTTLRPPVGAADLPAAALPELRTPPVRSPEPAPGVPAAPQPAPREAPVPAAALPPPPVPPGGAPTAGPRQGPDRATAPSAAASAPLRLDLPSGRVPLPGLASPRVLNLVPPPPERKTPLAEGIEKAGKADCRKAYAGMGLLGVVPLAADAVRDGGCRW